MAAASAPAAGATVAEVVTSKRAGSITNTQEANVDEGDIVKARGDLLIILRRGRLFTVSTAAGGLKAVDRIDAYAPGASPNGAWYDEMLIAEDRVIIIGYAYARGGTEVNRFRLSADGHLKFEDSYQLRSADYYSSRNYASRLIGHRLVLYSPIPIGWARNPMDMLPAVRRWTAGVHHGAFERTVSARHIFITSAQMSSPNQQVDTLHAVTSCDVTAPVMRCDSQGVLGAESRSFYVSEQAVYLWVPPGWRDRKAASMVYRMPLSGGEPTAVQAHGAPVDQFAFREDAGEKVLNVLVRSEGDGDRMGRPEFSGGTVALARIPLQAFGDGSGRVRRSRYTMLPGVEPYGDFHERYVGNYVLYGAGSGWGRRSAAGSSLMVVNLHSRQAVKLPLEHPVDRIEALGGDALAVGSDQSAVHFTSVNLFASGPKVGDHYVRKAASEAETRSHGFFFRPDERTTDDSGVLGLPIARAARPAFHQLFDTSAAMVFLRREDRRLSPLGELAADSDHVVDDHCKASCVDWYGNARPIFLGRRTFALMGYELVEGALDRTSIHEVGRIDFSREAEVRADR